MLGLTCFGEPGKVHVSSLVCSKKPGLLALAVCPSFGSLSSGPRVFFSEEGVEISPRKSPWEPLPLSAIAGLDPSSAQGW